MNVYQILIRNEGNGEETLYKVEASNAGTAARRAITGPFERARTLTVYVDMLTKNKTLAELRDDDFVKELQ